MRYSNSCIVGVVQTSVGPYKKYPLDDKPKHAEDRRHLRVHLQAKNASSRQGQVKESKIIATLVMYGIKTWEASIWKRIRQLTQ